MAEELPKPRIRQRSAEDHGRHAAEDELCSGLEKVAITADTDDTVSGRAEKSDTEHVEKHVTWATAPDQIVATEADKTGATDTDKTGATEADKTGATDTNKTGATEADKTDATEADETGATDTDITGAVGTGTTGVVGTDKEGAMGTDKTATNAPADVNKSTTGESGKETSADTDKQPIEHLDEPVHHPIVPGLGTIYTREREIFSGQLHSVSLLLGVKPNFTSVSLCKDGRLILTDFGCVQNLGFVVLYDPVKKFRSEIRLPCTFSAVQIDKNHIAVTLPKNRSIKIIKIGKESYQNWEVKTNVFHGKPWTLAALSDGSLAVGWTDPPAFSILDVTGDIMEPKTYMTKDKKGRRFESFGYFAVDESRRHVIQSCTIDRAVYCFNWDGFPVFRYGPVGFDCPEGIALDRDGNIFVCDYKNCAIHNLSPIGEPINIFTDAVPECPRAICPDIDGTGFWVTQSAERSKVVHLTRIKLTVPGSPYRD